MVGGVCLFLARGVLLLFLALPPPSSNLVEARGLRAGPVPAAPSLSVVVVTKEDDDDDLIEVEVSPTLAPADDPTTDDDPTDDDDSSSSGDDDASSSGESPSFVQGYVFVVVIALVLFCGCACLSANSIQTAAEGPLNGAAPGARDRRGNLNLNEDRFVSLRDSLVESGETVWVCFICAYENKPRAPSCALCGASPETTRNFDDRLRLSKSGNSLPSPSSPPPQEDEPSPPTPSPSAESEHHFDEEGEINSENDERGVRVGRCPPISEATRLTETDRAHAFTIGRLNELTLRQKGAARRRVWRRRRRRDGSWKWVREGLSSSSSNAGAITSRRSLAFVSRLEPSSSSRTSPQQHGVVSGSASNDGDDDDASSRYDVRWSVVDDSVSGTASDALLPRSPPESTSGPPALRFPLLRPSQSASASSTCCSPCCASSRRQAACRWRRNILDEADGAGRGGDESDEESLPRDETDLEAVAASPFRYKQAWFERRCRAEALRPATLDVRRAHVLADSVRRFEMLGPRRLARAPLRVRFRGEAAVDAGGVVREWYEIVAKALFSSSASHDGTNLGLFETRREAGYAANLNPHSGRARFDRARKKTFESASNSSNNKALSSKMKVDDEQLLRFAGRFVAKALRDRVALPVTLALPLLKHVLGVPLSFADLEHVDADAFQSYAWVRDNDPSALGLTFSVDDQGLPDDDVAFKEEDEERLRSEDLINDDGAIKKKTPDRNLDDEGVENEGLVDDDDENGGATRITKQEPSTHELVPNGAEIAVSQSNKAEFLALVLKHKVLDSTRRQLVAFLRGFDDVLDRFDSLAVFDYQELQLLVGGVTDIDVDDWKRHTRYLGAFAAQREKHPVVAMFWHCVENSFDQTDRARLCQFVTASSQLPPSGFKALVGDDGRLVRFTLSSLPRTLGLWPRAHTCFNRLDLPLYKSYEELHSYLSLTIRLEITGFSME